MEALLAAAPGAHPSVVTNGLEAWAKSQRQADEIERDEIRKLLPTVEESDPFKSFYESELVRLDTAIANVSPTSAVVFGLVVRGPAEALKALAATPGVRLVDVGEAAKPEPDAVFRGLRPEETAKVGQPATRPSERAAGRHQSGRGGRPGPPCAELRGGGRRGGRRTGRPRSRSTGRGWRSRWRGTSRGRRRSAGRRRTDPMRSMSTAM